MEIELLSAEDYVQKICDELKELNFTENLEKLAQAFAACDQAQNGTIDKSDLRRVIALRRVEKTFISISKFVYSIKIKNRT